MAQTHDAPALSAGNHLYLYKLLVEQVGCGRQTFVTRIEEALATDRMTAEDLGFASTRELLEELDEFVELRVFKGGRIYATIVAQPAWDAALAEQQQEKASGKPARRRGRGKAVRPVKPRRVRREPAAEPTAAAEPMAEDQPAVAFEPETANQPGPAAEPAAEEQPAAEQRPAAANPTAQPAVGNADEGASEGAVEIEATAAAKSLGATDAGDETLGESASERPPAAEPAPQPTPEPPASAISLTIVYDPDEGSAAAAGQPEHEADDVAAKPIATAGGRGSRGHSAGEDAAPMPEPPTPEKPATPAQSSPVPEPAKPAPAAPDTPPSAQALRGYPEDFAREVYLPPALEAQLAAALPLGMSAAPALANAFDEARCAGTLVGNRAQVRFEVPLPESPLTCTATITRRSTGAFAWALSALELKAR